MAATPPRDPGRSVTYEEGVKEELRPYLNEYEYLGEFILAIEWLVRHNPEDEETEPIGEDYPNMRAIRRRPRPESDLAISEVSLLFEYDQESVTFWAADVKE
jgi:hypothetical protein